CYSRTPRQGPSSSERLTPDPVIAVTESACFRPEYRLHQAGEFAAVFQYRRVSRGVLFDLHWRPNGLSTARLGLVVPKRLARRAVLRNLIKRIAREHFRRQRLGLPPMDLILKLARKPGGKSGDQLARPGNLELRGQLAQDVDKLFLSLPGMPGKLHQTPTLPEL
ncbi:MAG TPA: ribonuclease P protein component, partial [Rhodocyclaceae bacterium]|nr:ribonuclease P protein component [Rhodocyclaceae bacterium]